MLTSMLWPLEYLYPGPSSQTITRLSALPCLVHTWSSTLPLTTKSSDRLVKPWLIGAPSPSHLVASLDLDLLTAALMLPALAPKFGQSPLPPSLLLHKPLSSRTAKLLAQWLVHLQPLAQLLRPLCLLLLPVTLPSWMVTFLRPHPCLGFLDLLLFFLP